MILADTSAWIEYLRRTESEADRRLAQLVDQSDELVTTEVVVMEVLAGARDAAHRSRLRALLYRFPILPVGALAGYELAAGLYAACRRGGETVRALNDCLIAGTAIRHDAAVLHRDRDFEIIARHSTLRLDPRRGGEPETNR